MHKYEEKEIMSQLANMLHRKSANKVRNNLDNTQKIGAVENKIHGYLTRKLTDYGHVKYNRVTNSYEPKKIEYHYPRFEQLQEEYLSASHPNKKMETYIQVLVDLDFITIEWAPKSLLEATRVLLFDPKNKSGTHELCFYRTKWYPSDNPAPRRVG